MKIGDKVIVKQYGETYEATILEIYKTFVALDMNGIYQEAKLEEIEVITDKVIHVTYNGHNWNVFIEGMDQYFGDYSTGIKAECMHQAREAKKKLGKDWVIEAETLSNKDKSLNMKQVWKESKKSGFNKLWK